MTKNSTATVKLSSPIKRGGKDIAELVIRKPNTGALRGCNIASLLQMNVDEVSRVLPRITDPMLTDVEVHELEIQDFTAIALEVSSFLATGTASTEVKP